MDHFRVFIPTRDSARHVGAFLTQHRMHGIEPLYIVDGRSRDETLPILKAMRADVVEIMPAGPFGVTELIEAACARLTTDWVIRFDDDELPNAAMIDFIARHAAQPLDAAPAAYSFCREWVRKLDGRTVFYRVPRAMRGDHYDIQHRMFRNHRLRFDHQIHTAGIESTDTIFAPPDCFLVHFDMLIKTPAERVAKVRRYEQITRNAAWNHADFYMPELYRDENYLCHSDGLDAFSSFIERLPQPSSAPIRLTRAERREATENCCARLKRDFGLPFRLSA